MSALFHRNLVEIRGHRTLEDQASRLFRSHSARQNDRGGRSRYGSCTIIYLSTAQLLSQLVSSKHLLSSYRPSAISAGHRWSLPSRKKKMGKAVAHVDAALLCLKHRYPRSPTGGRRRQSSPKLRPWDSICKRGGDSLTTEPLHFRKSCLQWLSKTNFHTKGAVTFTNAWPNFTGEIQSLRFRSCALVKWIRHADQQCFIHLYAIDNWCFVNVTTP